MRSRTGCNIWETRPTVSASWMVDIKSEKRAPTNLSSIAHRRRSDTNASCIQPSTLAVHQPPSDSVPPRSLRVLVLVVMIPSHITCVHAHGKIQHMPFWRCRRRSSTRYTRICTFIRAYRLKQAAKTLQFTLKRRTALSSRKPSYMACLNIGLEPHDAATCGMSRKRWKVR